MLQLQSALCKEENLIPGPGGEAKTSSPSLQESRMLKQLKLELEFKPGHSAWV